MLDYIYKINKFRVNFETVTDEEENEIYREAEWETMYMDVEFFKIGCYGDWNIDIYLSTREDYFSILLDKEEIEERIDMKELNKITDVEEMEKALLKKINELYNDGVFVPYIDEYFSTR